MKLLTCKKGGFVIHFGFGVFLLLLLLVYIVIANSNPELAINVTQSVAELSKATQGMIP